MNKLNLVFLGDISLNGQYETLYGKGKNPFNRISKELKNKIIIGNLECFARGDDGVNTLKKPRLETSVEALNLVKYFNLNTACLANNHVYDHLDNGFQTTCEKLKEIGVKTVGASLHDTDFKEPLIIENKDVRVGLLNYVTKDTNPCRPDNTRINLNVFDESRVILEIEKLKDRVDHVVLCLHWGGRVEGGIFPDFHQPILAKRLIDLGADLIVGHHSHTVQPYEKYKGKYIFYSLGNFCFSDFVFDGVKNTMPNRRRNVFIPSIAFDKNKYSVKTNYWFNFGCSYKKNPKFKLRMAFVNLFSLLMRFNYAWRIYFFWHRKIDPVYLYFIDDGVSFYKKISTLNFGKLRKHLRK